MVSRFGARRACGTVVAKLAAMSVSGALRQRHQQDNLPCAVKSF